MSETGSADSMRADPPGTPPARRVLVVDDNPDQAQSLSLLLGILGHEVETAGDGPGALAAAERFLPDIGLIDIGLPGMDGFEVARRLRALPGLEGVVLVAQTGWGQDADRRRSEEAGFDHHVVKPLDLEHLQRILSAPRPGAGA